MQLHHDRILTAAAMLQPKCSAFLIQATRAGYRILVVRVWESTEDQWLKFQQGREPDRASGEWLVTEPHLVVTNALPGQSAHNLMDENGGKASMALDIIPLDQAGTPLWGLPGETEAQLDVRWQQATGRSQRAGWAHLWAMAGKCGLDAYGDEWGAFLKTDLGHLEEPAYKLIMKALRLRQPTWAKPTV